MFVLKSCILQLINIWLRKIGGALNPNLKHSIYQLCHVVVAQTRRSRYLHQRSQHFG